MEEHNKIKSGREGMKRGDEEQRIEKKAEGDGIKSGIRRKKWEYTVERGVWRRRGRVWR